MAQDSSVIASILSMASARSILETMPPCPPASRNNNLASFTSPAFLGNEMAT